MGINLIPGPINGQLVQRPNPKVIHNLSCTVDGIGITTSETTSAFYSTPLLPEYNSCVFDGLFFGFGNWTSSSSTGIITYTFSQPITSVTIGYTAVDDNDTGQISINNFSGVELSNPCGVDIIGTDVISSNYPNGTYGNVTLTVSSTNPFTTITLTNIGGPAGSGWVTANPCNFVINFPPPPTNCPKIYLDMLCYHATQNQTTTFSIFDEIGDIMNGDCAGIPCLVDSVPCSESNVLIFLEEPLPFGCTINSNGTVTIPAGTLPFYHEFYYRLSSTLFPSNGSQIFRASFGISPKVIPANPIIFLDADSQPNEVYDNGSVSILFGDITSQINTSMSGVCGYIPAVIDQPSISNTVNVVETTTPENPYYRINTTNGFIVFRPPYSESNPPPAPTLPERNYFLTYQMCINNTGAVSFCETGVVTINHYYNASRLATPSNTKDITIYPNPSSDGIFTLFLDNEKSKIKLEVYDMFGQNVYDEDVIISKNHSINLENFSKGIYLLKIKQGDEVVNKNIVIK